MTTVPSIEPTAESLTNPLTLVGLALVAASILVAAFALGDGDVVTALGMGLVLVSGVIAAGIGLSDEST